MRKHYTVGGHSFTVDAEEAIFTKMEQYNLFLDKESTDTLFTLHVQEADIPIIYKETYRQDEVGQLTICGESSDGNTVLEYQMNGKVAGWVVCSHDFKEGTLFHTRSYQKFAVNNALMMMYAFSTSNKQTALFHSSVVSYQGKAYMFLGKSGTGKSTHVSNWMRYIEGCDIMNDDNPIIRIIDGKPFLFGSPWSGKTPCYRNISAPLGGLMLIERDEKNFVKELTPIIAFSVVLTSCSAMKWDERLYQMVCATCSRFVETTKVASIHCLPNREAVEVCKAYLTE
jgi:hypothetical protein